MMRDYALVWIDGYRGAKFPSISLAEHSFQQLISHSVSLLRYSY